MAEPRSRRRAAPVPTHVAIRRHRMHPLLHAAVAVLTTLDPTASNGVHPLAKVAASTLCSGAVCVLSNMARGLEPTDGIAQGLLLGLLISGSSAALAAAAKPGTAEAEKKHLCVFPSTELMPKPKPSLAIILPLIFFLALTLTLTPTPTGRASPRRPASRRTRPRRGFYSRRGCKRSRRCPSAPCARATSSGTRRAASASRS
uniref:Uncharacterized protein n=1 Tax=Phaeomonas parva TaxID=124430 RepID=A0A7S1U2Q7_9STRA|mmetsp:Transcript_28978/g.92663  ORF Transcript_28978/g.92663 Transcript_28978/m.92663 type:complete len:202 (+) Transcript_28978:286-891(+)